MRLLYEQGPVLVLGKPSGILTQAPPGIDSLEERLRAFLKRREGRTGNIYIGVPHRLDRPASGAIAFARHARATRRIGDQFEARQVTKTYWALAQGVVAPAQGTWIDTMHKVHGQPLAEVVPADHPEARQAVLHYRTLGEHAHGSWLEVELETGRMHQIRLQAATRGWPLLGDTQYGGTIPFGMPFDDQRLRAIGLHARRLAFTHPTTAEPVDVVAPLSVAWRPFVAIDDDWQPEGLGELTSL